MSTVVQVRIESASGNLLESAAVLNGGFSTSDPSVLLPTAAALRLWSSYPAGTSPIGARTAGGKVALRAVGEMVSIRVRTKDREGPMAQCRVLVSDQEDEILLSDYAIDALGVRIERQGPGEWRFADESTIRQSVPRQFW